MQRPIARGNLLAHPQREGWCVAKMTIPEELPMNGIKNKIALMRERSSKVTIFSNCTIFIAAASPASTYDSPVDLWSLKP